MCGLGNGILLEGPINSVARKEGLGAEWLICTSRSVDQSVSFIQSSLHTGLLAEVALEAGAVDPLDTGVVAAAIMSEVFLFSS